MNPDAKYCWQEIKPTADELSRIICSAPIPANEKGLLGAYTAAHFFGMAACLLRQSSGELESKSIADISKILMNLLVPMMEQLDIKQRH